MVGIVGMIGGAIFVLTGPAIGLAEVLSRFGAVGVKNVGDSLLYYFPETESGVPDSFRKALV
jgi:hypothetical protein